MRKEAKYAFRKELDQVHKPNRCDCSVRPRDNEIVVENDWQIVIGAEAEEVVINAAKDLADYFMTSMNVSADVHKTANISSALRHAKIILIVTVNELKGKKVSFAPGSYLIESVGESIIICGRDARGAAQGCYYLEDVMNLREAPFFPKGTFRREPVFSSRMVHSGWGIDRFPDSHLKAIAHAGINSILLFTKDVNKTTVGYLDFNDLIRRAGRHGLDVYFYSYLKSLKHPRDKRALEFYENTYGKLFKKCPGAKGVILVGESCEFPSRDLKNTTGKFWNEPADGLRQLKPSPGWWPCYDYPEWLNMLKKVIRKHNPSADIVFWTYNWGYAPEKARIKLIDSLPKDITLLVTFEMFEQIKREGITCPVMDYTISFPGPGKYFLSEAKAAKKRDIKLYAMSNTGGLTWDFGVVPYIPVPQQWMRRHARLHAGRLAWGLSGLMDSHHYGLWPSEVSELAKWSFWKPSPTPEEILKKIAERDYGKKAAPYILEAWKLWSDGINDYIPSNEDQYGPCRVGPSYPLIFHPDITRTFSSQEIQMPADPKAHFGWKVVKTFYHPFENIQQSPAAMRYPVEIKCFTRLRSKWMAGIACLEKASGLVPPEKRNNFARLLALGKFIANTLTTTIHIKKWWLLNQRLLIEANKAKAIKLLAKLEQIARDEIKNAQDTIPLVEAHSRLGWEPSMEYMTDRGHLEWKIRQVGTVLNYEIPTYRKIVCL
jgi:hypothetical protein